MTEQALTSAPETAPAREVQKPYAGFWIRACAFILDNIFIAVPVWILTVPFISYGLFKFSAYMAQTQQTGEMPPEIFGAIWTIYGFGFLLQFLWVILFWLYFALMESGPKQATWGKRICGLRVSGADGKRLSFARASGRAFAKFLSYITLYIGFMMAGWTKKKQALHDFLAETVVVKNR